MQATVIAQTVYPPGEGKTNWAIIAGDGMRYSVPPKFSTLLQQGASLGLTYDVKVFNGKDTRMVSHVTSLINEGTARAQLPPQQAPSPAPRSNGNGNGLTQAKEIFITGIVGRAMGSGQFASTDIKLLALAAAEAWDALGH